MRRQRLFLLLLALMAVSALVVNAQGIIPGEDDEIDPDANISWPPPVYVLRGEVEIFGSANLPDMNNYFLEYRSLEPILDEMADDATTEEDEAEEQPWFPVTLPESDPVVDGPLGTWNTETTMDGLYELRLTVNIARQPSQYFVVSPLRIENEPPGFVTLDTIVLPTATPAPLARPTLLPSPTPVSRDPQVTANLNANVRAGDSTQYEIVGALRNNLAADVVGISSRGTGWYLIELPTGGEGWISPSVVSATGDFSRVPRVAPPPPPVTNTPIPPTPVPGAGDLVASAPSLNPSPVCNQPFQVLVNVTNTGTQPTSGPSQVLIQDVHLASGTVNLSVVRDLPVLQPGENFVIGADNLIVSAFFEEQHQIVVTLDYQGQVNETNEFNNSVTAPYVLARGGC